MSHSRLRSGVAQFLHSVEQIRGEERIASVHAQFDPRPLHRGCAGKYPQSIGSFLGLLEGFCRCAGP